jgi:hypothetical protein
VALLETPNITVPTTDWPSEDSIRFVQIDNSPAAVSPGTEARWLWKRICGKPLGEIVTDLTVFVMGVAVLYSADFFIVSHATPIALRYLIELVVYLNQHAAAAIEIFR